MRLTAFLLLAIAAATAAFSAPAQKIAFAASAVSNSRTSSPTATTITQQSGRRDRTATLLHERISDKRRKQLGIGKEEDEYDLDVALTNGTDPLISKIIAGSLILAILALLVVGVIVPSLTDYGEGVCNPITTQGRC